MKGATQVEFRFIVTNKNQVQTIITKTSNGYLHPDIAPIVN